MTSSRKLVIGLGSNLGDRLRTILAAFQALEAITEFEDSCRSSVWQTAPLGGPPQADYYNAALAVRSVLSPPRILHHLLQIEQRFGRIRMGRNTPRTLDLDLLWIDAETIAAPDLAVPHPRLHERAFALAPMLEVVPAARHPVTGETYAAILAKLGTAGIERLKSV